MFSEIELENFKAFGNRVKIPLAPITLIFGENSAGKSSILQALNLLKQTQERNETGAPLLLRLGTEDGIVDLGSFNELVFNHAKNKKLFIKVAFTGRFGRAWQKMDRDITKLGYELSFEGPTKKTSLHIDKVKLYWNDLQHPFCTLKTFNPEKMNELRLDPWDSLKVWRPGIKNHNIIFAQCEQISRDPSFWESYFKFAKENKLKIIQEIKNNNILNVDQKRKLLSPIEFEVDEIFSDWEPKYIDESTIEEDINFYKSDFDIDGFIDKMINQNMQTFMSIYGFSPMDTKNLYFSSFIRINFLEYFDIIHEITSLLRKEILEALASLFPLGPYRRPPERWYLYRGTDPIDVGYNGEFLPDLLFRKEKILNNANVWLSKLDIGYKLVVNEIKEDFFEVRLVDINREIPVEVGLKDVGFGISQILPFLVQSLTVEEQIISIEQPEVHIHPRLQADLGDLIAHSMKKLNNQFLIETHSEHLILRLQKLVRNKVITPDDISVLFVKRGKEGSTVQRLRLDEEGYFIDDWPGGFFPERLNEIM